MRRSVGPRARLVVSVGLAAVVLLVLAAGALVGRGGTSPTEAKPKAAPAGDNRPAERSTAEPTGTPAPQRSSAGVAGPTPPATAPALRRGSPDAPVTIVEFGDYQCRSCGEFARETEPALVEEYVERGIVQLVWRDFPWVDEQSVDAAVAARAAGRQGEFWAYHDALFAQQLPEGSGKLTTGYLREVASRVGLDLEQFDADVGDPSLRESVTADREFGQALGVPGTPAFLIGGTAFFGAQPLPAFRSAIEDARRRA